MMSMVGAAVAPDTAPRPSWKTLGLRQTPAATVLRCAGATRTTDNRHVSTGKIGPSRQRPDGKFRITATVTSRASAA